MRALCTHLSLGFSLAALVLVSGCSVTAVQDSEAAAATQTATVAAKAADASRTPPAPATEATPAEKPGSSPQPDWVENDCIPGALLDTPARVSQRRNPKILAKWFPEGKRIELSVVMEVTPEGRLGRLAFSSSDTDPRVLEAILQSFQGWRFKPGIKNGQPVTTCFEQPYDLTFPGTKAEE